jgi:hypothetical protein
MSFQRLLCPPVNHHMVGLKSTRPDESQKQRLAHGLSSRERFFVPPKLLCGKGFSSRQTEDRRDRAGSWAVFDRR